MDAADDLGLLVVDPRRRHTIISANGFFERVAGPLTGAGRPIEMILPDFPVMDVFSLEPRRVHRFDLKLRAVDLRLYATQVELLHVFDRSDRLDFYIVAADLSAVPSFARVRQVG